MSTCFSMPKQSAKSSRATCDGRSLAPNRAGAKKRCREVGFVPPETEHAARSDRPTFTAPRARSFAQPTELAAEVPSKGWRGYFSTAIPVWTCPKKYSGRHLWWFLVLNKDRPNFPAKSEYYSHARVEGAAAAEADRGGVGPTFATQRKKRLISGLGRS
jgi:hypothetical protein